MQEHTDSYGWNSTQAPPSTDYLLPAVLSICSGLKAQFVLDLGCGNGVIAKRLQAAGFTVTAIDADQAGIDLANEHAEGVRFLRASIDQDPRALVGDVLFDVVVSTEVVEHLFSPHLLVQFARRCLRSDGSLVLTTPYHGYVKNLALSLAGKWDVHMNPLWHGGHIKLWSRKTIGQLLADNGFQIVACSGVGRIPGLWKSMIIVARPC